jgi:hypothetical protein
MNQTLALLTKKYGAQLKAAGVSNEETARFLAQITRMILSHG